ncbi:MAG: hypothetical protein AB7K09_17890 [Planctomycetota bacterium]
MIEVRVTFRILPLAALLLFAAAGCNDTGAGNTNRNGNTSRSAPPYESLAAALQSPDAAIRALGVQDVAALDAAQQATLQRYMRERAVGALHADSADALADAAANRGHHLAAAAWLGWDITPPLAEPARHERLLRTIDELLAGGDRDTAIMLCDLRLTGNYPPALEARLAELRQRATAMPPGN